MTEFETTLVLDLPLTRQQMGFSEGDGQGNAILFLAEDFENITPEGQSHLHEGVCITPIDENIHALLAQMNIRWCAWPDKGFTLVVLPHDQLSLLPERLVLNRLREEEKGTHA